MRFKWFLNNATAGAISLDKDPYGFEDIKINLKRDRKLHGIITQFTFDLEFHCDGGGKEYIDAIYEAQGIDALITIQVDVQCEDNTPFESFFDGRLNLTKQNRTINTTKVNIEENNIRQIIKSRFNTPVDLAKTTSIGGVALSALPFAPYTIDMHGRALRFESKWRFASLPQSRVNGYTLPTIPDFTIVLTHDYPVTKNELKEAKAGINGNVAGTGVTVENSNISELLDTGGQLPTLNPATYKITWNVAGDFIDHAPEGTRRGANILVTAILFMKRGANLASLDIITLANITGYTTDTANPFVSPFNNSGTSSFTLLPNEKIWVYWVVKYQVNATSGPTDEIEHTIRYDTFEFDIETIATTPNTDAKGFAIYESFARITEAITDETDVFESTFFGRKNSAPISYSGNGCGSFTAIMSGLLMRGFDEITKPFSLSLKTLFESGNALWNLGIGIDTVSGKQKLIIEEKDFFYSNNLILRLDNVRDLEMNIEQSLFWSDVEVGYKDFKPEQLNGLDEFATVHNYALNDVKRLEGKLTLISRLIASGAVIEETRQKSFINFATEDFEFDDKPFVIALNQSVDGGGVPTLLDTPEQDENYGTSGIIAPDSVYNLRFSVKRMLLRHMNVIGGAINKVAGSLVVFQDGQGNTGVNINELTPVCNGGFSGVGVVENSNIAWDNSNLQNEPLWVPEVYSFNFPLSWTDYKTIRDNKNGFIEFSETTENHIKGYLLDLSYDINKGTAEFKLLRKFEA